MFDLDKGLKLKKLYIENYKVIKEFKIDFTDSIDKPLPIIIIAGVNGSGKTTLLDYIYTTAFSIDCLDKNSFLKIQLNNQSLTLDNKNNEEYPLTYIKVFDDNIKDIKKSILDYFRKLSREKDSYLKALKEIQIIIDNFFESLNLQFTIEDIDDIDRDNEKVTFRNINNNKIFSIESLSTGEKTLLSKVLYLYFRNIKNQIILIDEPELSIHPTWQSSILKIYEDFANKNNCQIIIATHSPHIIGSAKSEWIRLLTEDGVIDNISKSYGLEFNKVLTDIMGLENLRTPDVAKQINKLWEFLENEDYSSNEYKNLYKELENMLGNLDKDIILARLEVAKLKSQNA
ncbi:MAG: AAA family ATPase [Campylobacterota bacterium]|nr:AAA family ATPase [Campylobacterota bacterium]